MGPKPNHFAISSAQPTKKKMTENHISESLPMLKMGTIAALSLLWISCISGTESLNIGPVNITSALTNGCSNQCESSFCTVAPLLKYGKYCGVGYSGCPGEVPCDALDACCKTHDACIKAENEDYLSTSCNQGLLNCIDSVRASGAPTFQGSNCDMEQVTGLVYDVIELALVAGRVLHQP